MIIRTKERQAQPSFFIYCLRLCPDCEVRKLWSHARANAGMFRFRRASERDGAGGLDGDNLDARNS